MNPKKEPVWSLWVGGKFQTCRCQDRESLPSSDEQLDVREPICGQAHECKRDDAEGFLPAQSGKQRNLATLR